MKRAAVWIPAGFILATSAFGACLAVEGDRIRIRDLARAIPAFERLPAEHELGYAPSPGVVRRFPAAELARIAARFGVAAPAEAVCVERPSFPLRAERLLPLLRRALGGEEASIEILDLPQTTVPEGELEFARSGLAVSATPVTYWRGRLRYAGSRSVPVWAKVRVLVRRTAVMAATDIPAGGTVEAEQLRTETRDWPAHAPKALERIEEAAGLRARRAIRQGQALTAALLSKPRDVERGDTIRIESGMGGVRLEAEAKAETAGSAGDWVLVRNLATGKRVRARVVRKGQVRVDAS